MKSLRLCCTACSAASFPASFALFNESAPIHAEGYTLGDRQPTGCACPLQIFRFGVPQGRLRLKELRRCFVRQRLRQRGVTRTTAPAFLLKWDLQNTTDMSALSSDQTSGETRPPVVTEELSSAEFS